MSKKYNGSLLTDEERNEFHRLLNKMREEQCRMELYNRGFRAGLAETIPENYDNLIEMGYKPEEAFKTICEDYPEFEPEEIRRFLDEGVSDDMFGI